MNSAVVFGAGGLMGSAVADALQMSGFTVSRPRIAWDDPSADAVVADASRVVADEGGAIFWCAGQGVPASKESDFITEERCFTALLDSARVAPSRPSIFLASSAGAVFAGRTDPPYSDDSEPKPLTPYGETRIAFENMLQEAHDAGTVSGWAGRVSNLYGPRANLRKKQGLISHIIDDALHQRPINIYVPLETKRDYLYSRDCADMIVKGTEHVRHAPDIPFARPILCTGVSETITEIIAAVGDALGTPPVYTTHPSDLAKVQPLDLSMVPTRWANLDNVYRTPLTDGIAAALNAQVAAMNA